jgi:hypothetical protein
MDWNAYDHILFLIALVVVYDLRNWKKVLWLITLFTLGHTISLLLATYKILLVDSKWVELFIPLTILITALSNIFFSKPGTTKSAPPINLFFAVFFGLIHGLGFSGYFNMIVGKSSTKFIPLLEFALGVEFSQVLLVVLVLLLGAVFQSLFRFSKRDWILVSSAMVIGMLVPILEKAVFW